jgi:hypothetical protein
MVMKLPPSLLWMSRRIVPSGIERWRQAAFLQTGLFSMFK